MLIRTRRIHLIFYILVDYIPSRKKEQKALLLVNDHMEDLNRKLDEILTDLMFFAGIGNSLTQVKEVNELKDFCQKVARYEYVDKLVPVRRTIYIRETNELFRSNMGYEKPLDEVRDKAKSILNTIQIILEHKGANQLEEIIVDTLICISESRYLQIASTMSERAIQPGKKYILNVRSVDIELLLYGNQAIREISRKTYTCHIEKPSEEELRKQDEEIEKFKKEYPEQWKFMMEYNK